MSKQAVWTAALATLLASSLAAQQMGQITGLVRDTTGGAVPGAVVTAEEAHTGYTRSTTTDHASRYVLPSLRPTAYVIKVEMPGFKKFARSGTDVLANQSLTINITLDHGDVTETVATKEPAPLAGTSTSALVEVVDQARILELPLNGRNTAELTTLAPGIVAAPTAGVDQGNRQTAPGGVVISSNGSRQDQVSYRLDGGNHTDFYTNINQPLPFPDALQEFSIQTSGYSAAFGNNAGAVVNAVTKSGTKDYHATAFGFDRNRIFNARNFFSPRRDFLKREQFGASGGGPVRIPHLYDGRNKTFFFLGYEGTRLRNTETARNAFVPTNDELAGNFANCGAPCSRAILDPLSGKPFPGNQIPLSRLDPAALKLAQGFLPRASGNGLAFFDQGVRQDTEEGVAKIDHMLTSKDRLSGRYFIQDFRDGPTFTNNNLLTYRDGSKIRSQNFVLNETHTFSPTLMNEFHFTYNRVHARRRPPTGAPSLADFGVNIAQPGQKAIESVNVAGFFGVGDAARGEFVRNGWEWSDQVHWVRGRHNFTFGGQALREHLDISNQFRELGAFSFTGDVTGLAPADFLLGRPQQFEQGSGQVIRNRNTFVSFFAQDDFKVNARLTVNVGIRYEPFFPWREEGRRFERFRPADFQNGIRSLVFRNAPPGLLFRGDPGFPKHGVKGDYNNVAPRVGFAYDVFGNGKTVVRGGAGLFYDQRQAAIINNDIGSVAPFATRVRLTQPAGGFSNPFLNLTNPFPAQPANANSPFPQPVSAVTYSRRATTPVLYQWNLSVEREVRPNWLVRLAYVGSHGSHETRYLELNPAVFTPGTDGSGNPLSTTANTDARRLFAPSFGSIRQFSPDGNSSYHSMQLSLNKRFSNSFTILASYTFSKSLDNLPVGANAVGTGNPPTLPFNFANGRRFDSGPSDFDHTHRGVVSYVWDLPKMRTENRYLRKALHGWQYTGIFQAQSGSPLTILSGLDNSLTGLGLDRAVLTGQDRSRLPGVSRATVFFNPSAFAVNPVGTFGAVGKGRLHGPELITWDMGVFKNTAVRERINTQFRAEFFNAFNHVNFNNPNTTVSSASFGRILSAQDPRIIQLGFKVQF